MDSENAMALSWILGVVGGLGSIVATCWVVFVIVDGFRRRQQLRLSAEFQTRLLERIGSAREFGEFLGTESGARFLDSISVDRNAAQTGILRTLQAGIVSLVMGSAFLVLARGKSYEEGLLIVATVSAALGAGLLLASALSYLLSKRMGMFDRTGHAVPDKSNVS
jgi:hypothetical protein